MVIKLIKIYLRERVAFAFLKEGSICTSLHEKRLNICFLCQFSGLYILSFVIIMVGFVLYCSTPTQTAEPTTVPQPCNAGLDNAALKLDENDSETPAVAVHYTRGESVVVSTD